MDADDYQNQLRSYRSVRAYCLGKWGHKLTPLEFVDMGGRARFEQMDWKEELEEDCFYNRVLMERFKNGE